MVLKVLRDNILHVLNVANVFLLKYNMHHSGVFRKQTRKHFCPINVYQQVGTPIDVAVFFLLLFLHAQEIIRNRSVLFVPVLFLFSDHSLMYNIEMNEGFLIS